MSNTIRNQGPPSPPPAPPSDYYNSSSQKFIKYHFVNSVLTGNHNSLQLAMTTMQRSLKVDQIQSIVNRKYPEFNDHTALYMAVTNNYSECCRLLVINGAADVHLESSYTLAKKKGGEVFAALEPSLLGKILEVGECSLCEEVTSLYTYECGHIFCYDCSGKWAKECASTLTPKCPQLNCPVPVHVNVFQNLLTSSDFNTYINTLVRTALSGSDMFEWCPNCPSGIFLSERSCTAVSCPDCREGWCSLCKLQSHSQLTCEEAKIKQGIDEQENNVWKAQNSKQCPKCKVHIQKSQGCSHITCRQCNYQFCWICLGKYQPGKHTFNINSCPCNT